jgi:hypothetical protein
MKATQWREIFDIVLVASLVLLALTLVLPSVKFPESENYVIPGLQVPSRSSQVEFYDIPPVDAGAEVNVVFTGFQPACVQFALSPVVGDQELKALAYGTVGSGKSYSFSVVTNMTSELRLLALSFNGSGYTLQISSVWSPFYPIRVYTAPAVFLIIASGLGAYYYRQQVPRQRAEEKVEAELRAESEGPFKMQETWPTLLSA